MNPTSKPTPAATTQPLATGIEPLVDENEDPKVKELREENKRLAQHNTDLAARLNAVTQQIEEINTARRTAADKGATAGVSTAPLSKNRPGESKQPVEALIPTEDYDGPPLGAVYLHILSALIPKAPLGSDRDIDAMGANAMGIAERCFHQLIRRTSFRRPEFPKDGPTFK